MNYFAKTVTNLLHLAMPYDSSVECFRTKTYLFYVRNSLTPLYGHSAYTFYPGIHLLSMENMEINSMESRFEIYLTAVGTFYSSQNSTYVSNQTIRL